MGNAFIVGDVHGNYPKLKAALQTYGYREGDDVIFVGDLMDRGYYNAKVARFVKRLGDKGHIIQGNHELQHRNLMLYYQTIINFGPELCALVADIFKFYKVGVSWPKTKEGCCKYQCSLDERKEIIGRESSSFEEAVKRFIVYTLSWDDARLWEIVCSVMDVMCGPPYDAEHTLYEYFAATQRTRDAMEYIWDTGAKEINITVKNSKYARIVVTHNNPFGHLITSQDPKEGQDVFHKNVLYVFGHIPVEKAVLTRGTAGCGYLDIDLSPKDVGVYKLTTR